MPVYDFYCKKCDKKFDEICSFEECKKVKCSTCKRKAIKVPSIPTLIGTSSNLDNFDYRAHYNMEKAQNESRAAKEEAKKRGISPGYKSIDDVSSGNNFDPSSW